MIQAPPTTLFDTAKEMADAVRTLDSQGAHPILAANKIFHALLAAWEAGCKSGAEALRDQLLTPSEN